MIQKSVTIINKLGLHARASSKLVALASRFGCRIEISHDNQAVNAKSIMGVMMLGATQGSEILITIDGEDEETAMKVIVELIENRFGEAE